MSFKKSVSHFRLSNEGCISQWRQDKTTVSTQPTGQCSLTSKIHVKPAQTSWFQKKEPFLCEGVVHQPHKQTSAQDVITATFLKACLNLSSASACIIFERLSLSAGVILKLYESSRKQVWASHLQPTNTLQSFKKNPAKMALRLRTFWLSISVSSWESSEPFFSITECLCSGSTLLLNGMRGADLIVHDWNR